MRYVLARYKETMRDRTYRIYVTDSLFYQTQGKALTQRYADLLNPKPQDTRSGDDIAADIITKLHLRTK